MKGRIRKIWCRVKLCPVDLRYYDRLIWDEDKKVLVFNFMSCVSDFIAPRRRRYYILKFYEGNSKREVADSKHPLVMDIIMRSYVDKFNSGCEPEHTYIYFLGDEIKLIEICN